MSHAKNEIKEEFKQVHQLELTVRTDFDRARQELECKAKEGFVREKPDQDLRYLSAE